MKRILSAILSVLCISGLLAAPTVSREETAKTWRLLARDIAMWNKPRPRATETVPNFQPPESEVLNRQALIWPEDRDPLDVLLRRTEALADDLQSSNPPISQSPNHTISQSPNPIAQDRAALAALAAEAAKTAPADEDARYALFTRLMRLRKAIAWKNPLVRSIRKLLFVTREAFPTQELDWGTHICDQFFGFHARLKESTIDDGLYVLEDPFGDSPKLVDMLYDRPVEKGPWKGRKLRFKHGWDSRNTCGFLAPDVSYDGKDILFCATRAKPEIRKWNDDTVFHIFRCHADGSGLEQLTSGNVNDLFPCWELHTLLDVSGRLRHHLHLLPRDKRVRAVDQQRRHDRVYALGLC